MNKFWLILMVSISATSNQPCFNPPIIQTQQDFQSINNCKLITGKLTFLPTEELDIDLDIETIKGGLHFQGTQFKKIQFKKLTEVSGDIRVSNTPQLEEIDIRKLQNVQGSFIIENADRLHKFFTNGLINIIGQLTIEQTAITNLPFPNLNFINGEVKLKSLQKLKEIDFPALEYIGNTVTIQDTSATKINMPFVHTLCNALIVTDHDQLIYLNLNHTQAYGATVNIDAPQLTEVFLGQLVTDSHSKIKIKNHHNLLSKPDQKPVYSCHKNQYIQRTKVSLEDVLPKPHDMLQLKISPENSDPFSSPVKPQEKYTPSPVKPQENSKHPISPVNPQESPVPIPSSVNPQENSAHIPSSVESPENPAPTSHANPQENLATKSQNDSITSQGYKVSFTSLLSSLLLLSITKFV